MHWTVGVKTASLKRKRLIYQLICDPPLAAGLELWAVTERMRSWIQAAEMGFLCRAPGFSLRDGDWKSQFRLFGQQITFLWRFFRVVGGRRFDPEQTRERLCSPKEELGIRSRTWMLMTWMQWKSSQDLNCPCPVILGLILGLFSSHKVTLTSTHRTVIVSLLSDVHLLEQTPANGYMAFTHRTVCFCSRRIQAISFVLYLSILLSFGCVITLRTAMSRRDAVSAHY